MGLQPLHPLDVELQALSREATVVERMELIWRSYEDATGDQIGRPPSDAERQTVHDWLKSLRSGNPPELLTKRAGLRVDASLSILEKAGRVVQLSCPACTPLLGRQHLPVRVQPWSAQVGNDENQRMKQLVKDALGDRSHFGPPKDGPLCVSVVAVLPRRRNRIDADNIVKGLLDTLAESVYENDRDIQCLTSRVMRNINESGHYLVTIKQVEPWEADVVWPSNPAPQLFA
jgi:Holliday junction resolvase RusA-like endonuclease